MRRVRSLLVVAVTVVSTLVLSAQAPIFDVVSIKRNTAIGPGSTAPPIQRPDGGFTMINTPVSVLIGRAYPGHVLADMVGLPDWRNARWL